jgi:stage II sporulation protein M
VIFIMPRQERRIYLAQLAPYLRTSLLFFATGITIGLAIVFVFPAIANQFEDSVANFIKTFRGLPRIELAGAIFFNNASKTLLAITLGGLFGIIPGIFLLTNGVTIGVVFSLATQSRGFALSLLSIMPHGVLEIPAVILGTSIGFMVGNHAVKTILRRSDAALIIELKRGLRYFCSVIAPLLIVAALVEAFVTSALVSRF